MYLHVEAMPDEPTTQAFLYGPLVLAGRLGTADLTPQDTIGDEGPSVRKHPIPVPALRAAAQPVSSWLQPVPREELTFRTKGQSQELTFVPFDRLFTERYSVYWSVV